jgi:hypothetical protein
MPFPDTISYPNTPKNTAMHHTINSKSKSAQTSHASFHLSEEFRFGCTLSLCTLPLPAPLNRPCIL